MRRRRRQAVCFKLALQLLRIAEQAAIGFDLLVAKPGEQLELRLQRLERAGGVELKRQAVERRHGQSFRYEI